MLYGQVPVPTQRTENSLMQDGPALEYLRCYMVAEMVKVRVLPSEEVA